MSARVSPALARAVVLAAIAAGLLSGCAYDYLQRTDRVSFKAGDAVHANLESETINPDKRSMYVTSGLGKNGAMPVPAPTVP